jgi:hypothetical protein
MSQLQGTVKWFSNAKGYGFPRARWRARCVRRLQLDPARRIQIAQRRRPRYIEIVQGTKGPQADQVSLTKK